MAGKDAFTEDEWRAVAQVPFLAGFAVTAADPGGLVGIVQESAAMARVLRSKGEDAAGNTLISAIAAEVKSPEGRDALRSGIKDVIKGRTPAEASTEAVARLKAALALVAATAPQELSAVSALARETAQQVAQAAKEGGFMGFGGKAISDSERKTLAEIEAALASVSRAS